MAFEPIESVTARAAENVPRQTANGPATGRIERAGPVLEEG